MNSSQMFFIFLCLVSSSITVNVAGAGENPFTPRAHMVRYWSKQIQNGLPKSSFLLSKASPLSAVESSSFSKLATQNSLSTHFSEFCISAKLFCFPDLVESLEKHDKDSNFATYSDKNFTNYGTDRTGGADQFKAYSENENIPVNSFRRYSRNSENHKDGFTAYSTSGNVVDNQFNTYGTGTTGGSGEFNSYDRDVNVVNAKFNSYSAEGTGRTQNFQNYLTGNVGDQKFSSYGKNANGTPNDFTTYGKDSNVLGSGFSGYGETANSVTDTFKGYSEGANNPQNNFDSYGDKGNGGVESFTSYRDQSNVGDDSFRSYAKSSNAAKVNFANYGQSFNEGTDKFTGYGQNALGEKVGFKIYGVNNTFKGYANKNKVTFAKYTNDTTSEQMEISGSLVNKWVEPGKFFRESKMKTAAVLPMPDINDKMPERSFLPRSISSKLPFSSSKLAVLKQIFHAGDNSTMEKLISDALVECERAPSKGETKRCVGSLEDMIDFVTTVLGRSVVVRTTENTKGSKSNIMIGEVRKINGGKVTKSVSCHQSLYPYLLYYCHSVPKVRVYEADILDSKTKSKINQGTAICHLDTSSWSSSHGAFLALGSSPGKIERMSQEESSIGEKTNMIASKVESGWEINQLTVNQEIGRGASASVYTALYQGETVAVKVIDWKYSSQEEDSAAVNWFLFGQEVAAWRSLDHPNITRFIGGTPLYQDLKRLNNLPFIVIEYLPGGTLKSFLYNNRKKKLAFDIVQQLALDIARGLSYLHSKRIVHRDIKPDNMLLDKDNRVKITDFGMACLEAETSGRSGTVNHMAPEVIQGKSYNRKLDVYSFGICLWEIYCCDIAFSYMTHTELMSISHKNKRPKIPMSCPRALAKIMKKCWKTDPEKRPEMKEVVSMLEAINQQQQQRSCCFFLKC